MPQDAVTVSDARLGRRELEDAALVAARAFHTDPFFRYLAAGAVDRARGLALYFHSVCANLGPSARLLTARSAGEIVGVAAWVPPGAYPYPLADQLRQLRGALRALYRVPSSVPKGLRYLLAIDRAHPKEPLWYLQLLVADPEHQRRGVGAALLEGVLEECDRDGAPAYLETQKQDNLAYYRRFGFDVTGTLQPMADGPPLWTMRRAPKGAP